MSSEEAQAHSINGYMILQAQLLRMSFFRWLLTLEEEAVKREKIRAFSMRGLPRRLS